MNVTSPRPSLRLRSAWTIRLMTMDFRRHRLAAAAGCCAFACATLALFTCASYVAKWGAAGGRSSAELSNGSVELVAFLRADLPASSRDTLSAVLGRLPGVARVRVLSSDEVLSRMRSELGDRASVLDGVEEGFLPATLEVTLHPGSQGAQRVQGIAWRLRRMDGITDVDVLRSAEDQRVVEAEALSRRLGQWGMGLAFATMVLSLCLAGLALHRPSSDARLFTGLGFTVSAMVIPAALAGAMCAVGGAALAACVGGLAGGVSAAWWPGTLPFAPLAGGTRTLFATIALVVVVGAILGWLGSRPSGREMDGLEANG